MHKQAPAASFICSICKDTHETYDSLVDHSAIHASVSYVCPLCKASVTDYDSLESHMQAHKESERHACEFCDFIFLNSSQLQKHIEDDHVVDMVPYQNEGDYSDKAVKEESELLEELLGEDDSPSPPKAKVRKLNSTTKSEGIDRKETRSEHKGTDRKETRSEHKSIKKEDSSSRDIKKSSAAAASVSPEGKRSTRSKEIRERVTTKSSVSAKKVTKSMEDLSKKGGSKHKNGKMSKSPSSK